MADVRNNYSFIRVAPCSNASRGDGSLGKALGHLDKHKDSSDISKPELSHLNKHFIDNPKSFRDCIKLGNELLAKHNAAVDEYNKANGLKGKKAHRHQKEGTYQFFEGVMTYSPDMEGQIPLDRWSQKSYEFIKKEYEAKGCEILRCDLHCDENSIHMQFVIACFDNKAQSCSYRNLIGGKASLSQLQDRYGDDMAEFGLVRGFSRYKETQVIKKDAADYFGIPADKLTPSHWNEFCHIHGLDPKRVKRHSEISKYKAEKAAKQSKELDDMAAKLDKLTKAYEHTEFEHTVTSQNVAKNNDNLLQQQRVLELAAKALKEMQAFKQIMQNPTELEKVLKKNKYHYGLTAETQDNIVSALADVNEIDNQIAELNEQKHDILQDVASQYANDMWFSDLQGLYDEILAAASDIDMPLYWMDEPEEPEQNTPSRDDEER